MSPSNQVYLQPKSSYLYLIRNEHELSRRVFMRKASLFLEKLGLSQLNNFDLNGIGVTSLLMSGRNEPMASRKG